MPTSEPVIHASPLAVYNIRAVMSAYREAVESNSPEQSPEDVSRTCNDLRITFLKAFSGLFQKRVTVTAENRGYYTLSTTPDTLGDGLAAWLKKLSILVPKDANAISASHKSCVVHQSEIESLIALLQDYLDEHYGASDA